MTNRVCIVAIGDPSAAHDVVAALAPSGGPVEIKNKYFEATISFDFDAVGKPPAVLYICFSKYCDLMPPPSGQFQEAELRLLLRVVDETSNTEIPEKLKDWEVDNFAEIIDVRLATLDAEIRQFKSGEGRSGLLDESLQPAGCRIMESLEMVNWPIKVTAGKSRMQQKVERLEAMLSDVDPHSDSFENAMQLMLELKTEIPNLPDEERHKYAAQVALAFEKVLMRGEMEEEEEEEEGKEPEKAGFARMADDDEEAPE